LELGRCVTLYFVNKPAKTHCTRRFSVLNITKSITNGKAVFALEGRLDTNTASELDEALSSCIKDADKLEFDLSKLEYISSAGLRILLAAHKEFTQKGGMKVTGVSDMVMEIFSVTGFTDILTIE